jgi:hypothetical protein
MQNPGSYRVMENFPEDERFFNDSFASVIENDYVLNYLNDPEAQRRTMSNPNLFGQQMGEMPIPFTGYADPHKSQENLQNLYGKINIQEPWLLQNMNEGNKMQFAAQQPANYKMDPNSQDIDGALKTKKVKLNRGEIEVKRIPDVNLKNKSNIKNTYINKINSLIVDPKVASPEQPKPQSSQIKADVKKQINVKSEVIPPPIPKMGMKKVRSCDVLKSDELEKLNQKLAKNRESARNSRIRKKVYIDLLEKTVDQLQKELTSARKQLENNTNNLSKLNFQSKPLQNLHTGKTQLFERLEKMVDSRADESEVSLLIDSLRFRFGASGKERIEVVNYMFKQVVEFLVPVHMKYLLWAATQNKDMFNTPDSQLTAWNGPGGNQTPGDTTTSEYWAELSNQVSLSESQKKNIVKYKKKLLVEKQKFESIVHSLNQVRKNVLKQANSLQSVVDDFRNYLTPTQTAKLLLVLEKEKNRKEFSAEKLWNTVPTKKENQDDGSEASDNFLVEESDDEDEEFDSGNHRMIDMEFMDQPK